MSIVYILLAAICFIYFIFLILTAGIRPSFAYFWFFLSVAFMLYPVFKKYLLSHPKYTLPLWLKVGWYTTWALAFTLFLTVEGFIVSGMFSNPAKELDYIVVLGARVRGETVSLTLKKRLDQAFSYLAENPQTKVVVSGGQGAGEDISEAEAMERYLLNKGIGKERIIKEAHSTNTQQNIKYSHSYILVDWYGRDEIEVSHNPSVGIVSDNYHIFRAKAIGHKIGWEQIQGIPARTDPYILANQMVREFFAVLKDRFEGNI